MSLNEQNKIEDKFQNIRYTFNQPTLGHFFKREKRFFSYFYDNNQNTLLAHCPNTGKMSGLLIKDALCLLSSKSTGLSYTWEAVKSNDIWIGVNTSVPNKLVEQLLLHNLVPGVENMNFQKERLIKHLKYKPDFSNENIIIEVKNVHLVENNIAYFPDCITERGSRQMKALINLQKSGKKCIVIYILQRPDVDILSIHPQYDIEYLKISKEAQNTGIQCLAFNCNITETSINIKKQIQFK